MKFEEGLKRLEYIIKRLDDGNIPLDEALKYFEEGLALTEELSKILNGIEKRIEMIFKKENGSFEKVPFQDPSS